MRRFWSKVEKRGEDECWEWQGSLDGSGYGGFRYKGKLYGAHRMSMLLDGQDIEGMYVLHTCDNRKCVNTNHLYLGNHQDNMKDRLEREGYETLVRGVKHHNAKLDDDKVREIWKLINADMATELIGKMFNVSGRTIRNIRAGKIWRHVTL